MAWALLRFPYTERAFRKGLLRICHDEVRHMQLYAQVLTDRGVAVGQYPVRDWFWKRIPTCETPLQFVSLMGLGVEAANLEHSQRFAQAFEAAGDDAATAVQRRVEEEEVSHVAFGRYWFERWNGALTFDRWCHQLPAPLSPLLMRALPLNVTARTRAGMTTAFLNDLADWAPEGTRANSTDH